MKKIRHRMMKRFSLNAGWLSGCCLLLVSQISIFGFASAPGETVSPLHQRNSLPIEANVFFGEQDEEIFPVETRFFLLDKSLIEILKSAGFTPELPEDERRELTDEDYLEATGKALTAADDAEAGVVAFLIQNAIRKHQKLTIKTDHRGRGIGSSIAAGNYYLFGIGTTGAEIFVWHLPIRIEAGRRDRIELNQDDAAVIFPSDERLSAISP